LSTVVPLGANHDPTTEPRMGPAHKPVFAFDKPVNAADAFATEGNMTGVTSTTSGNEVIVSLSGVVSQNYVTAANFIKDVNATGTLTVADKGVTNANLTRALPPP
jgi:hypothetical protein